MKRKLALPVTTAPEVGWSVPIRRITATSAIPTHKTAAEVSRVIRIPDMVAAKSLSVLIVDDSDLVRTRLGSLMQEVSSIRSIRLSRDVREALRACETVQPNLALIDLRLPDGSGIEVLRHLRRTVPACTTILLSTLAAHECRHECLAAGADYFFNKATEFDRLTDVLTSLSNQEFRT